MIPSPLSSVALGLLAFPAVLGRAVNGQQAPLSVPATVDESSLEVEQLLNRFTDDPPPHILTGVGLSSADYEAWEDQREWMYFLRLQIMDRLRKEVHLLVDSIPDSVAPPVLASTQHGLGFGKRQVVLDPSDPLLASPATSVEPTSVSDSTQSPASSTPPLLSSTSIDASSASSALVGISTSTRTSTVSTQSASSGISGSAATSTSNFTISNVASTPTAATLPALGEEEQLLVEVVESNTQLDTPVGPIIQQCLTMVSDPSQTFCRTLLNGQAIGSDAGFGQLPVAAPVGPSSAGNATSTPSEALSASTSAAPTSEAPQIAQVSQSSSSVALTSTATSASASVALTSTATSASASASSSSSAETSISVDVVVNGPSTSSESLSSSITAFASSEATPSPTAADSATASEIPISSQLSSANITTDTVSSSAAPTIANSDNAQAQATAAMISIAAASASAAAAARAEAEAVPATEVPGQRMSVLPIGLGVLGGLAGIAVLVVGYVMWERKKYRSQFVRRKEAEKSLADQGAVMGGAGAGYGTGRGSGRTYDV